MGGIPDFCRLRWAGTAGTAGHSRGGPGYQRGWNGVSSGAGHARAPQYALPGQPELWPPFGSAPRRPARSGLAPACSATLAFGEGSRPLQEGCCATIQGLSGTGSLRVRAFLKACWASAGCGRRVHDFSAAGFVLLAGLADS